MAAVLGHFWADALIALRRWRNGPVYGTTCKSCGAPATQPLDECLSCLGDRHW